MRLLHHDGYRVRIDVRNGERRERLLDDDAAVLAGYHAYFGISFDRVPMVSR